MAVEGYYKDVHKLLLCSHIEQRGRRRGSGAAVPALFRTILHAPSRRAGTQVLPGVTGTSADDSLHNRDDVEQDRPPFLVVFLPSLFMRPKPFEKNDMSPVCLFWSSVGRKVVSRLLVGFFFTLGTLQTWREWEKESVRGTETRERWCDANCAVAG